MNTLEAQIEELLYNKAADFEIAKVLKKDIKLYFDTLEETFATSGGKDFLVKHTKKIDSILKIIYKVATRDMFGDYLPMKNSIPLGLVALGSYGREQLCVHSDIDLMLVYKDIPAYNVKEIIEKILYILWDTGLKLGHRVHTIDDLYEVSKTDITIKTALIESRMIEGSIFIWTETQNAISQIRHDNIKEFIQLKLEERELQHRRFPLTMEPNLKDGSGGFRDANLVFWIGKILYNVNNIKNLPANVVDEKEYRTFRIALEFLFRVRSALHLTAGKKEDQLRLELIPDIARLLGYEEGKRGQMKCAKKVTESLKIISLYSTIWLNILTQEYIADNPEKNYLYPKKGKQNFNALLQQLSTHAQKPFYAHPTFIQKLITAEKPERPDELLYKTIKSIFHQPYSHSTLKVLSYARLMGYTIPPMRKAINLPQFDGYHQFAVDMHSIRCVYHLENIEDPFIKALFEALNDEEKVMLKIVTFLHDAGKGRERDHHLVGASLFKVFAEKLNLDPQHIAMGETLILYHTLMSKVAQRDDIYNENTVLHFASHFQTKKLLDLIYILTYADMNGVGKDIYNSFNARLIRILYQQSLEILDNKTRLDEAAKRVKKEEALKRNAAFKTLTPIEQKKVLQIPSDLLFLRYSLQKIVSISKNAFTTEDYTFKISNINYLTIEVTRRKPFNISYLLGKLSTLEVVHMDICKLFDDLKYFKIDFSTKVNPEEVLHIKEILRDSFDETKKSTLTVPVIGKDELKIDCEHSKTYAVMYLNCKNQKGLLAYVIKLFDEMGIDIATAKIHTLKRRVRDLFLIEKNGKFCHNVDTIIDKLTGNQ
ncbi:nucleotidyltransferase [Sulfurovum sp. TSL6]|uniref:[protein-PII] uridylyltransferase family protein n=1 Tax=Sulfurovum sp. TSL6 TaxID=2826995 RepID=UPI001CC68D56|nr:HD domain-containing protein [Sulfurovum sp. TSL6]GIU01699.1 nucleotidyltransferase [Sulfurovum sp. TSL6]